MTYDTESICPVCLSRIPARRVMRGNEAVMVKDCQDHGRFEAVIWRGEPAMDTWLQPGKPVHPPVCHAHPDSGCPFDCGLCERHQQLPCSALLEVTNRCDLECPLCFADSTPRSRPDPDLVTIASWYAWNLDLEKLRRCCISVVAQDGRLVPFCAYNLTGITGQRLYRDKESH
ncbi:MAG: hypothetical protein ABSC19_18335 [Syntrophorhabdales bacterium]|jgi:uncharacterized radical SAM superfamily Fe-S cluster-containing enzyme